MLLLLAKILCIRYSYPSVCVCGSCVLCVCVVAVYCVCKVKVSSSFFLGWGDNILARMLIGVH